MTFKSKLPAIVAVILAGLVARESWLLHQQTGDLVIRQEHATAEWQNWRRQIDELTPMQAKWESSLPTADSVADQYRIVRHLNVEAIGLSLPEQGLTATPPQPLAHGSRPLAIASIGLSNIASGTLQLGAQDFATAYRALSALTQRPDVRFDRARITLEKGAPSLTLTQFAILARTN